jgi:hypothetical protein
MPKFNQITEEIGGWSVFLYPIMKGHKSACCDCGLVHEFDFGVVEVKETHPDGSFTWKEVDPEKFQVRFRVRRDKRSTGQRRRYLREHNDKRRTKNIHK